MGPVVGTQHLQLLEKSYEGLPHQTEMRERVV